MKEINKPVFEGLVMVCDDNNMNAMVICDHLKRVGLKVIISQSGNDGIDRVQKRAHNAASGSRKDDSLNSADADKQFDLIFMDIHMPVMDGLEASMRIKEIDNNIPIVALTTDKMFEERKTYIDSGIVGYLGKPFKTQELWECLTKYLKQIK